MSSNHTIEERLRKLGLQPADGELERKDQLSSSLAALSCFPMYMVANVHAWTPDRQWKVPVVDIPGFEQIREAYAIEKQEATMSMTKEHRALLGTLLWEARPMDLVMYEYALETLAMCLDDCDDDIANSVRTVVARTIMAVAKASGEGLFGTGEKISAEEQACIDQIAQTLDLRASETAADILDGK
ncbi:MAG: hypothetical protein Tsb009_35420 [Planctomycetaceae bacterium]